MKDLTIIYRVSERTVYRILAENNVLRRHKRKRAKRKYTPTVPVVKELKPCGTDAAYQRHRRKKEYPCTPCLEAHALAVKIAKQKRPKKARKKKPDAKNERSNRKRAA